MANLDQRRSRIQPVFSVGGRLLTFAAEGGLREPDALVLWNEETLIAKRSWMDKWGCRALLAAWAFFTVWGALLWLSRCCRGCLR
jgi:hypothetical protein